MLTTTIVDDKKSSESLKKILTSSFNSQIHVCDMATNLLEGIEHIKQNKPDIVFLNIDLFTANDFTAFQDLNINLNFEIVFTSSNTENTLCAIKNNAFDYLIKPIETVDIISLLKKYEYRRTVV